MINNSNLIIVYNLLAKLMNMKCLFFILLFASCSVALSQNTNSIKDEFVLNGHIKGRDTGLIVLNYTNSDEKWMRDTTYLKEGVFQFKGSVSQPTRALILGNRKIIDFNSVNIVSVFLESGIQNISLKEDDYEHAIMKGSKTEDENKVLKNQFDSVLLKTKYLDDALLVAKKIYSKEKNSSIFAIEDSLIELMKPRQKEFSKLDIIFVVQHPDSYVSLLNLGSLVSTLPLDSAELLFNGLTERIKKSQSAKWCVKKLLERQQYLANSYSDAYDFKINDSNGKEISLSAFKNKFVLLHFWASWCIPCIEQIPRLKEYYNNYHDKGLEIITVSMDTNKKAWIESIQKHKLNKGYNILANEEIFNHYDNARSSIPNNLLINKNGKIFWDSNMRDNNQNLGSVLEKTMINL